MSTTTEHLELIKPEQDDFYDVDVFNSNADKIDENFAAHTGNTDVHVTTQEKTTWNNKSDKQNEDGGFAGGQNASAGEGGATGMMASANLGGATGSVAATSNGGAVGYGAMSTNGGAVGSSVSVVDGGAIGSGAVTSDGFAGGKNAKTLDADESAIDAVQLGSGTNSEAGSLQVYSYKLMDAEGKIPAERLPEGAIGGDVQWADQPQPVATSGTGSAYTATIPGITALYSGLVITILPHTTSTSKSATLNLNGLGAKSIYRYSNTTAYANEGYDAGWILADKPVILIYNGLCWMAIGPTKAVWNDIMSKPSSFTPSSHASTATTYGVGTDTNYGHVKLTTDLDKTTAGQWALDASVAGDLGGPKVNSYGGFGAGTNALARAGAAIGSGAMNVTGGGAALGQNATVVEGGAVGHGAQAGNGFAGGYNAVTKSGSTVIDAIQLGTGTNTQEKTFKVYDTEILNSSGTINGEALFWKTDVYEATIPSGQSSVVINESTVTTGSGYGWTFKAEGNESSYTPPMNAMNFLVVEITSVTQSGASNPYAISTYIKPTSNVEYGKLIFQRGQGISTSGNMVIKYRLITTM